MPILRIDHHPRGRDLWIFAVLWFCFFLLAALFFFPPEGFSSSSILLFAIALVAPVMGFLSQKWLRRLYLISVYAVSPIGFVVSFLLLLAFYYFLVTPTGLLLRFFRYDPLHREWEASRESYWDDVPSSKEKSRYFRQF
jgi:hypothetical protein